MYPEIYENDVLWDALLSFFSNAKATGISFINKFCNSMLL